VFLTLQDRLPKELKLAGINTVAAANRWLSETYIGDHNTMFFMGSPSFLAHQRRLADGHGRSNCQTLFAISAIPTDADIRQMLDGAPPSAFDPRSSRQSKPRAFCTHSAA